MKNFYLTLALVLSASSLPALQPKQTLNCDDQHHGNGSRANYCEMRESTTASAGAVITVDASPNGGIAIKGWDRADVLVRAQIRTSAASDAEARDLAKQINIQTAGAQIKADGPASNHDRSWSVTYEVFVPTRSSANAHTTNGGINIEDVLGSLEFKTVNGGVNLRRVGGSVHGQTTNGGLNVELAGDHLEGQGMDLKTTNGGVNIVVPQNFSAQLEAETRNGGIHTDTQSVVPVSNRSDRHVSMALGRGGALMKITTTNGGVNIKHK
jgi:DUF4097 and DUF4098 domain-containing protein YvlB